MDQVNYCAPPVNPVFHVLWVGLDGAHHQSIPFPTRDLAEATCTDVRKIALALRAWVEPKEVS